MKALKLFFFAILVSTVASSQNQWYFGNYAGVSFNNDGTVTALTDGKISTQEGVASISDVNGDLLFYTDGVTIWDKTHTPMPNANGNLNGNWSSTESATIVPNPINSNQYYVFTIDELAGYKGFSYSIIDMTLSGNGTQISLGDVVLGQKNIQLLSPCTEKIEVMRGYDNAYWIVVHGWNNNNFYAYKLDANGLNTTPIISSIGKIHTGSTNTTINCNAVGYMKASPQYNRLALINRSNNSVDVFDFNITTGVVSNEMNIYPIDPSIIYGLEFSPNGKFLFHASRRAMERYSFETNSAITIAIDNESLLSASNVGIRAIQIGPDNNIYVSILPLNYLSKIENPESENPMLIVNAINLNIDNQNRYCQYGLPAIFYPAPQLPTVEIQQSCKNDIFRLTATSNVSGSFLWSTGETTSTIQVPNIDNKYFVTVTICEKSVTDSIIVKARQLTDELVLFLPFNGNTNDESGNGNNGIVENGATLTTDRFGIQNSAYHFDGINDFISIVPSSDFNKIGDFTFSVWANSEGWQSQYDGSIYDRQVIFDGASNDQTTYSDFYRDGIKVQYDSIYNYGRIQHIQRNSASAADVLVNNSPNKSDLINKWHHLVFVRSGSVTYNYVDGQLWNSYTTNADTLNMQHNLYIGTFSGNNPNYNSFNYNFKGKIDDVQFYKRALTECEIQTIYTLTPPQIPTVEIIQSCVNDTIILTANSNVNGSFLWNTSETTSSIFVPKTSNTYSVTVSYDGNTAIDSITLNPISTTITKTDIICDNFCNGTASVTVNGGFSPYNLSWINGETNSSIQNLCAGNYSVTVSDSLGCSAVGNISINEYFSSSISGIVKYSNGQLMDGEAEVILYSSTTDNGMGHQKYATTLIDSTNTFTFNNIPKDDYYIKVDFTKNQAYPNMMNSYYDSTHVWAKAKLINLNCDTTINLVVNMYEFPIHGNGNGHIEGHVNGSSNNKTTTTPVYATVTLISSNNQVIASTTSDEFGFYSFDNIPDGEYSILIDIPGLPQQETYNISITPDVQNVADLNFVVKAVSGTYAIYQDNLLNSEITQNLEIETYPNPFNNTITIKQPFEIGSIEIIDFKGSVIRKADFNSTEIQIDLSNFDNGIYNVKLQNNKGYIVSKKILKVE